MFFERGWAPQLTFQKVSIRDTRSSNGTWINGTRLSSKGEKSDRFSLQCHDILVSALEMLFFHTSFNLHRRNSAKGKMAFHRSRQRFSMILLCMFIPYSQCDIIDNTSVVNSCVACKSLPVMISSPLVPSLKRHRTLSAGGRNSPKPALRHRLSVSFSPHVQVPNRNHSGNESDETLMGTARPRSLLQDSTTFDDKALPKTPKLERSSSITSFTTVKTIPDNLDAVSCVSSCFSSTNAKTRNFLFLTLGVPTNHREVMTTSLKPLPS
jgi:hypothetical protein